MFLKYIKLSIVLFDLYQKLDNISLHWHWNGAMSIGQKEQIFVKKAKAACYILYQNKLLFFHKNLMCIGKVSDKTWYGLYTLKTDQFYIYNDILCEISLKRRIKQFFR